MSLVKTLSDLIIIATESCARTLKLFNATFCSDGKAAPCATVVASFPFAHQRAESRPRRFLQRGRAIYNNYKLLNDVVNTRRIHKKIRGVFTALCAGLSPYSGSRPLRCRSELFISEDKEMIRWTYCLTFELCSAQSLLRFPLKGRLRRCQQCIFSILVKGRKREEENGKTAKCFFSKHEDKQRLGSQCIITELR